MKMFQRRLPVNNQIWIDAFLFFHEAGKLKGMVLLWFGDFFHVGDNAFKEKVVRKVHLEFLVGFVYTGLLIMKTVDGITINQSRYIKNLETVPKRCSKRETSFQDRNNDVKRINSTDQLGSNSNKT